MERIFLYFAQGFCSMQWQQFVMLGIGFILIGLAVVKNYEPMLLLPIGFGTILVNLPFAVLFAGNKIGEPQRNGLPFKVFSLLRGL